jgi:hypothetical protein
VQKFQKVVESYKFNLVLLAWFVFALIKSKYIKPKISPSSNKYNYPKANLKMELKSWQIVHEYY